MNILLIYPEIPDTFWSFKYALRFIGKKSSSPPLGLITVAAMLPVEWNKRLVDLNVTRLTRQDLEWADQVFISAMTVQRKSVYQVIERCHEAGVKVVAGGPLFTIEYDQFTGVDHFILNEAELTLPPFLNDLESGHPVPIYATDEFADMSQTPVPLWHLVQQKYYATMNIQYSRGCPYNCEFCNVTALLGHKPRIKRADQIIEELDRLYAWGWRQSVFFVDDNLIGNKRMLKDELLPALIDWRQGKAGFQFSTEASINLADDESLMQMMAAAGFSSVFIGIETPEECSLAEVGKKQNLKRDMIADVKKIQRAGMQVQGGFIVGFDNDTPSTFHRVGDFIQKSGIVTAMVGLLQAPPGTQLYQRLQHAGRLLERMSGDNVDGTTNIVPVMNLEVLKEGYRSILQYIYSPEVYYQRIRTFLKEYKPPKIKMRFEFNEIRNYGLAFLRSVYRLGIVGKERKQYWKLFFWTLFSRPKVLPLAVTLMIYGYHFRRIIEMRVM
ncbi:MAG: DUF4070 domain-containing protein [Anaerolineales bacterium]|nr:DUF4070 domain-containing protein [Anaerolineales bacterium]